MPQLVEQLKLQAQDLPHSDRADLAKFLLSTLDDTDDEIQNAWRAEIGRRVAEIRNGTAKGRPGEEVMAELRRQLS